MFDIYEELKKLPDKPGVYIMKDKDGNIIYVGKASVLKNRVRQYFQSSSNHSPKVAAMVSRIKEFEYIVTDSELEALILECNLIKKHKPKFNVLLKDDKSYPYIKVTMNEEYPRIMMTRRVLKDGAKYFGPYSNVTAVKETIDLIKKIFPIKTCNKVLPRDIGKGRPCLNYHILQCLAPCQGDVNKFEYRNLMKDICSFLGGKQENIIKRLEEQMKAAAENMEFEKAARLRDKINSLKHISEKQKVLSTAMEDQDVIAFAREQTDACIQVFFIRGGKLIGREHFVFEGTGDVDDRELMTSFVKQFYSSAEYIPREIILQEEIDEINLVEDWLTRKRAARVNVKVPKKGDKAELVKMVAENAVVALNQFREKVKNEEAVVKEGLEELKSILGLARKPQRIEAYDISNTGVSENVGSMVVFFNGLPLKKEYRRFKIKTVEGQNDYASMQEIIYRRFRHVKEERDVPAQLQEETSQEKRNKKKKIDAMPDLILIDGGWGHLNAVCEVLRELDINVPAAGMVKDDRHNTRGLVFSEGEVELANRIHALRLVTAIQEEAHRFAVEYNRKLRGKRYTKSVLDEIEGIGPKRKKMLLKHFGSINRIKEAGVDDLLKVKGINRSVAEKIYEFFHG
ncbi:MAG TPA: excinuclease ABC subunit UvrC [Clostridiaceae bacterium]|nr:excinuclease ABC subunit UvrC [Clostridiaceae bacterium]